MQIGNHSQKTDNTEDDEKLVWRDLGNCRVFDSKDRVAVSEGTN